MYIINFEGVRSFAVKVILLELILGQWVTTGCMQLCFTLLHQMC